MPLTGFVSPILDYGEPSPRRSWLARTFTSPWLLLPLILLLAAALRWVQLDHESLWLDEFLAVQNSTGRGQFHERFEPGAIIDPAPALTRLDEGPGFGAIWSSLESDSHPPLYFMLLHVWRRAFGESDLAARALSVVFSLVSIVLLFDIARLLHGRAVALWAALLMALAGPQIQYAQEVRNYTMLLALVLGGCDALVRIEKRGPNPRRALALGGCLLAAVLTHYLAIWAAGAIGLYAILRLRGRGRELRLTLLTFTIAGAIFLVAWGPFFLRQTRDLGAELSAPIEDPAGHTWRELRRLAMLPVRYFTEPMKSSIHIAYIGVVMYVIPLLLLRRRPDLLLWCLLGGFVIFSVLLTDLLRSAHGLAYVRYTLLASPAVYALAAGMLWHMRGFLRHVVPLVLSISCVAALEEPYSISKADTREMAQYLAPRVGPNDILIIHLDPNVPGSDWQARTMYLGLSHYWTPPGPIVFLDAPPSSEVAARIAAADEVWMMSPSLEVPNESIFPGSAPMESRLVPYVGTVERLKVP